MPVYFTDRWTIAAPEDLGAAARFAADEAGLSFADFVREAVTEKLQRGGVRVASIPALRLHRRRSRGEVA